MGWVTYDDQGRMVKYYRKPGPAKAAVTRAIRDRQYYGYSGYPNVVGCCTYRDFEGILMGLRGAEFDLWRFCNTKNG